jgi:MFS family permease
LDNGGIERATPSPLPREARRNLGLLATGQGLSRLGDGLYVAGLTWTAWTLSHRTQAVAAVVLAANVPSFLGSVLGASFADRYDRRRIMMGCDTARAVAVLLLTGLLGAGRIDVRGLVAVAALVGLAGAPFAPARNAIVPQIVERDRLLAANGLLQVSFRSAYFVGPLLLAPLLGLLGLPGAFAADAATFACSILTLAAMRVPPLPRARRRVGLRGDLAAGWLALRAAPDVQVVIGTFVLCILAVSGFLSVGLVVLTQARLHAGAGSYGLLLGVAGLSEVAGALSFTRVRLGPRRLAPAAVGAWAVLGLFRLPLGTVTAVPAAAALLTVTGLSSAVTDIPLIALAQARIPHDHLAKVLGLWEAGIAGVVALSPALANVVLATAGVQAGFAVSGAATVLIALVASALLRRVRPA